MTLQATAQGFAAIRVAGFGAWKVLGRSVVKESTGLAVLAPSTYTAKNTDSGRHTDQAAPADERREKCQEAAWGSAEPRSRCSRP
jgi:hypothetical protein